MTTTHDVVVLGAGLSGLVTAALLQAAGREVLVVERSAQPGGLARSPALAGVPVNLGPHALYLGGPAEHALGSLGLSLEGFSPTAADAFFEVKGALVPAPTSVRGLLGASWLTWRERLELALALRRATSGDASAGGKTLAQWLGRFTSPRVRATLELLTRVSTYTNAPEHLAATLAHRQLAFAFGPEARGVRYLAGGWQALVDALAPRAPRRSARVERVGADGAVHLASGEVLVAADVVVALPLQAAAQVVEAPGLRARAAAAVPVRVCCLDVVLSTLPRAERRLVLGLEAPRYFSVHSAPRAAGPVWFHAAVYLRPGEVVDAVAARAGLEAFVDAVQPGWRSHALDARFYPHLTVMDDLPREEVVALAPPLHLVSTVASPRFLLDAALEPALRLAARARPARGKMAP